MFCANLPIYGDMGLITSADAKSYFTKKRVNGRWVHGRFAKHEASGSKRNKQEVEERDGDEKTPLPIARSSVGAIPPDLKPDDIASITYDVKNKTETVTYGNGKVATRPFDPERLIPAGSADIPTAPVQMAREEYERLRIALIKKAEALRTVQGPR
jgi:hypothetical protein